MSGEIQGSIPETVHPLVVKISREPGLSFVTLTIPDGSSEDLEAWDAEEWFRVRNADMDVVEKALNYVYNFCHAEVVIENPKIPKKQYTRVTPKI